MAAPLKAGQAQSQSPASSAVASPGATAKADDVLRIVALGDMPYGSGSAVADAFKALLGRINELGPDTVLHIGDTKSGGSPCSDAVLDEQLRLMNTLNAAVLYTPGDNEWTDCYRSSAGGFDPLERLAYIRRTYFAAPKALGQNRRPLVRQSERLGGYETYVENAREEAKGVLVVTAHVVGSNNGFEVHSPAAAQEFFQRDAANIAWLTDSFAYAKSRTIKAIVLAIHADMFEFDFNAFGKRRFLRHSGFKNFGDALVAQAKDFEGQVLLVYGDSHKFQIFHPFVGLADNITALEVYGASRMHAVAIDVRANDPAPFAFRRVTNPVQLD